MSELEQDEPLDPRCDPSNPYELAFSSISAAAFRIKDGVLRTPCDLSRLESSMRIYLKKDFMQQTGSFKERGARFALLSLTKSQRERGVISASAGNHAQALAYHGGQLGVPVTVVMPVTASIMKVENCRRFGANVVQCGHDMAVAKRTALNMARDSGLLYINGFDHPDILAGQGTLGLEMIEQVPDLDACVIPIGGGGLLAGCAVALKTMKPSIKIIGVEPECCPSWSAAMTAGKPVKVATKASLADGLTIPTVGVNAFHTAKDLVDKVVCVPEEWIAIAILRLVEQEKAVVEGGGAAGVAAILAGLLPELNGKKVAVPLCGGNIDTTVLGRCLERGLAAEGRLVKICVTVSDRPGGIAELAALLAELGVSIKDMMHERAWIQNDIFSVEVTAVVETRDADHAHHMFRALANKYSHIKMTGLGFDKLVLENNTDNPKDVNNNEDKPRLEDNDNHVNNENDEHEQDQEEEGLRVFGREHRVRIPSIKDIVLIDDQVKSC